MISDVLVLLGNDSWVSVAEITTDLLASAAEVLIDVVGAVGLAGETVLVLMSKVNDAVWVTGREELRVSSAEGSEVQVEVVVSATTVDFEVVGNHWGEPRSGMEDDNWDQDKDWSGPVMEGFEKADEGDVSEFCSEIVVEITVAE